jgi:23S rRNA pseudouridine2604 synthase
MIKGYKKKGRNKRYTKVRQKDTKSVKPPKIPGKSPIPREELYPMRINKYLSSQGYSTRRDADKLIAKKTVFINGKLAVLGSKVNEKDVVEVKRKENPKKYSYFAYNKPKGVITHSPQAGEKDIEHSVNIGGKYVFPVGRLDKDSHGLIMLTDDGRVTDRLLNPEHEHEKEYVVTVRNPLRPSFKMHMEAGVDIEGYRTKKCKVTILGDHSFRITLTEGKKHQIRRMCANLHNDVADLTRIRVMNIRLGAMKPNSHREIAGKELETFLKSIGL